MNNLHNINAIVKSILEEDEQARNSDSYLYLKVLERIAPEIGYKSTGFMSMSVYYFLLNMEKEGFPKFESVRRSRQKIQGKNTRLAASPKVEEYRAKNEKIYRDFARK